MRKNKKIIKQCFILNFIIICSILSFLLLKFFYEQNKFFLFKNKYLRVSFLDVGQGDASLIKAPNNKLILIDGGPDNLVLWRLGEKIPFYKRDIEAVIISHFHDDHFLGLIEIFRRYKVKKIILGFNPEVNIETELLFKEIENKGTEIILVTNLAKLNLDFNCEIVILNPLILDAPQNDNNSLISKLTCADKKFLFSGDNETSVEKLLIKSNFDLRADVFKASHHGSKTSNSIDFLQAINPQEIIISVGQDNRFNHPSLEVLDNIKKLDVAVWRTDMQGSKDFLANIK